MKIEYQSRRYLSSEFVMVLNALIANFEHKYLLIGTYRGGVRLDKMFEVAHITLFNEISELLRWENEAYSWWTNFVEILQTQGLFVSVLISSESAQEQLIKDCISFYRKPEKKVNDTH